ncbi:MAG TPA: branched-chain amino acid ABC transporter permease [Firmicutes bacterium]|nr:branched-chain amino acid ABC transporter permease [Bacillota bacterium]
MKLAPFKGGHRHIANKYGQFYVLLVIVLLLGVLPLPLGDSRYAIHLTIMAMIWSVVASSWDLLLGYAGIFSIGQVAIFTCGAYGSAMLTMHLHVSSWLGMAMGALVAGVIGILIGLPCLRLKGIYVALLTLAFFEALGPLLTVGRSLGTGGKGGLFPIPPLTIGSFHFSSDNLLPWYYVALAIFSGCLYALLRVIHSSFGLAFTALRDAEPLAESLGVNRYAVELAVTGFSSAMAGLAGGFYAHYVSMISPRILGLDTFLFLLIMIIVGGVGRFPGSVLGAFTITFLDDLLRQFETYRLLILGGLLVLLIIMMPGGLMGLADSCAHRWVGWKRAKQRVEAENAALKEEQA